jgi:hypothetical protein
MQACTTLPRYPYPMGMIVHDPSKVRVKIILTCLATPSPLPPGCTRGCSLRSACQDAKVSYRRWVVGRHNQT